MGRKAGELWPRLWDIRISHDALSGPRHLTAESYRALMLLVSDCAAGVVWTYTEPSDGSIKDDDGELARRVGVDPRLWRRIRPDIECFFSIKSGRWHLKEEWIAVDDRPIRYAIPAQVQAEVLTREGKVCTYCGSTDGPFDLDHILPVSKGGSNEPSNLTLACAPCNRSKGGRSLREWTAR